MDILDTIDAHAAAMRLPLYAVTLTTVARKDTPAVLILHWHGWRRATALQMADVPLPAHTVPGSALRLQVPWDTFEVWDQTALDAAWQLGAWDLERAGHRPWWRLNAPQSETLECYRAFGVYPDIGEAALTADETADTSELLELAAGYGYVRWLFRPRAHGLWRELEDDDGTLEGEDRRTGPCPVRPEPYDRHRPGRRLYRLGRGTRILT